MFRSQQVYDYYKNEYDNIKTEHSSLIKRKVYSNDEIHHILPAYFQRGFVRKGKICDEKHSIYEYDFDDNDRLIRINGLGREIFIKYGTHNTFWLEYYKNYGEKKENILRCVFILPIKNKRYTGALLYKDEEHQYYEEYAYEDDKIIRIDNPILFEYGTYEDKLFIKYNDEGQVIEVFDPNSWLASGIVYRKISREQAIALEESIQERIVDNIKNEAVRIVKENKDKLRYIAIYSHPVAHIILSSLSCQIALESQVDNYISKNGDEDKKNLANYINEYINIYDDKLEIDCNTLVNYYCENGYGISVVEDLLLNIHNKLLELNWSEITDSSTDFEVLNIDFYD